MLITPKADAYFSVDVETDGSIPGIHSMLSFGISLAGRYDGARFKQLDPRAVTLYRELKPLTEEFEPEAIAISGLDREQLLQSGGDPASAMCEACDWIIENANGDKPVFVAYPLAFDWMFFYWYLRAFGVESPFKHSRCLDMKSFSAARGRTTISTSGKKHLPEFLIPDSPHTHNALDDAIEQAELFQRLFTWNGSRSSG